MRMAVENLPLVYFFIFLNLPFIFIFGKYV